MALLLLYRKTAESDTMVSYLISLGPGEATRTLVIDKDAPESPLEGDLDDYSTAVALGMILLEHHTSGTWPKRGIRQS